MFGSFVLLKIDCYEKKKILIRTFLNKRIYQDKMHKLIIIFNELFMLKINKKKESIPWKHVYAWAITDKTDAIFILIKI